jgi:hypothetical protein
MKTNTILKMIPLCLGMTHIAPHPLLAYHQPAQCPVLDITGEATKIIKCDRAVFEVTLSLFGDCPKELLNNFYAQSAELHNFCLSQGVPKEMITIDTPNLVVREMEHTGPKKGNGYTLSGKISITTADVDSVEDLQAKIIGLIQKGLILTNQCIHYQYANEEALKRSLLILLQKQALMDGKKTAIAMAKAQGLRISNVPTVISQSQISCNPIAKGDIQLLKSHPQSFIARSYYAERTAHNAFTVTVPMTYAILNETNQVDEPEKTVLENTADVAPALSRSIQP